MKKFILFLIVILAIVGVFFYMNKYFENKPIGPGGTADKNAPPPTVGIKVFDPKNATYEVDGEKITLVNGESEESAAPGSATTITTSYFGNEATGDLNGDGKVDKAFLITQYGGGTGVFYYAVVALNTGASYKMTNAFIVGDRIAPQSTEISNQELHVNYATRKDDEPMTATPSVGAVLLLKVTKDGVLEGLMK